MNDDDLVRLLRAAVPPATAPFPARDLWPSVASGMAAPPEVSWVDLALAAAVAVALLIHPAWLWHLAYHL